MWVNWVTVLWILYDVGISIRTAHMQGAFTDSEWYAWSIAGLVLAVAAFVAAFLDRRADHKQIANLNDKLTRQEGIQQGGFAALGRLSGKVLETLEDRADKTGDAALRAEVAELKVELEKVKVGIGGSYWDVPSIYFWRPPNDEEQDKLEKMLRDIGVHSVRFNHHENTDCSHLARSLAATFALADWEVSGPHAGTYDTLGSSGILVRGKETLELASQVADAIRLTINASCGALVALKPNDPWDLVITIGPKGTVRSQLSRAERK